MKLYYGPISPYARKIRMLATELGLDEKIGLVATDPWTEEELRKVNPLCKVPALVLPSGECFYDSPVIAEYLCALAKDEQYLPKQGEERWRALKLQALADGMCDAAVRIVLEKKKQDKADKEVITRQEKAIDAAFAEIEKMAGSFPDAPTIGELAVGAALGYVTFRFPDTDWKEQYPHIRVWFTDFAARASMLATEPRAAA